MGLYPKRSLRVFKKWFAVFPARFLFYNVKHLSLHGGLLHLTSIIGNYWCGHMLHGDSFLRLANDLFPHVKAFGYNGSILLCDFVVFLTASITT